MAEISQRKSRIAERAKKPQPRRLDREQVELAQPALLENQTSALTPHASERTNVYAIGMAGWSDQNVFVKELDGGYALPRSSVAVGAF